jgi:phosphoribosylformylglycinamidine (FGAM) synthase PurS component
MEGYFMKIGVKVMPRKEVLDMQGRAVEGTFRHNGREINSCTVGRYVILDLPQDDQKLAMQEAKTMAEMVLHNPLIETFELEVI